MLYREAKSIWSLALNERNRAESDREGVVDIERTHLIGAQQRLEALQDSGIVFLGSKNAVRSCSSSRIALLWRY